MPVSETEVQLPRSRMALLFMVMLVTAAGNTAMQSVMPSIGTHLQIADVWVSLAYSWSALLWMLLAPFWARRSDSRGRKAMMALGLVGFAVSFVLSGAALFPSSPNSRQAFIPPQGIPHVSQHPQNHRASR